MKTASWPHKNRLLAALVVQLLIAGITVAVAAPAVALASKYDYTSHQKKNAPQLAAAAVWAISTAAMIATFLSGKLRLVLVRNVGALWLLVWLVLLVFTTAMYGNKQSGLCSGRTSEASKKICPVETGVIAMTICSL